MDILKTLRIEYYWEMQSIVFTTIFINVIVTQ